MDHLPGMDDLPAQATGTPPGPSRHGPAQDGSAQDGPAHDGPAQDCSAQDGSAQDGPAQDCSARPAQDGSAQGGPEQRGTASGGRAGKPGRPGKAAKGARQPADRLPVARVAVDISLPHLDRPFDYLVPVTLDEAAVPGCRVRVRFAGQLVDGFLLERVEESGHGGRLSFLERVTSPEPVLAPEIAALAREVADRYAGTLADVLRLAVPPRHARAETSVAGTGTETRGAGSRGAETQGAETPAGPVDLSPSDPGPWAVYPAGPSFLSALTAGAAPRAVWTAMPGPEWPRAVARAVRATLAGGRGALVVVADGRDVARVDAALARELAAIEHGPSAFPPAPAEVVAGQVVPTSGQVVPTSGESVPDLGEAGPASAEVAVVLGGADEGVPAVAEVVPEGTEVVPEGRGKGRVRDVAGGARYVALTAELGPAERYRRWLKVRRGAVRAVVGTRAAMFAPVRDLGLVVLWDDGDDVHAEPHAPYPHAREVLALRAHRAGAGAIIGGYTRTTDASRLVETGWARPLVPGRAELRAAMPRIRPAGDDAELARDETARTARLPALAFRTARQALEHGPVLVQVPRRGYLPALACGRCRSPARCAACSGPLALRSSHAVPYCRWCGRIAGDRRCPECGDTRVRAVVVGAGRTAEELGRAFPGVVVRTSGRDGILAEVGPDRALVVATPGAEPVAAEGYAAALLLDGWALLGRPDLRADEEALRRWMNAAALVRAGGPVVVLADGALAPVQALVRWDPVTMAERQLAERRELGFPPVARMASLTGTPAAVRELLAAVRLPDGAEILGPVPAADRDGDTQERALVRVARPAGAALAAALKAAQGTRSARKTAQTVRVQLDPLELI
jgi:primosomal protein N' (replication factor Y)